MPIYEYRCRDCGEIFEVLVRADTVVVCPRCGGSALEKKISAAFVSSGQMARQAGRTCCGRDERCATPPCSDGGTCRRG